MNSWKVWGGKCLYNSEGKIRVYQNLLYRWLQFDSTAIQTLISRTAPHKPKLQYIKPLILPGIIQPGSICMLGLGGGGAAHALSPFLGTNELCIVEKSEEVIAVAKRFFMIDNLSHVQIIHQDAYSFVSQYQNTFQHVMIDLFTADAFPKDCCTELFFSHCKRLLKPNGILALNIANASEHWPLFELIQKQFNRATLVLPLTESANIIILAQNANSITPFIELLRQHKKIVSLTWDSDWGYLGQSK